MKIICTFFFITIFYSLQAQLPVTAYKANSTGKPLLLYLSGDGGWNSFSTGLLQQLNKQGYPVLGVNSKSYFWKKKEPQEAANAIAQALLQYQNAWKTRGVILIGYSFGADVLPFIQSRLPKNLTDSVSHTVLMSPSRSTDFEIHVLGMMGFKDSEGLNVPNEIKRLRNAVTIIYGSEENDISLKELGGKDVRMVRLPGGHHYDGDTSEVAAVIINAIK